MDNNAVLRKFQDKTLHKPSLRLADGGIVVGTSVDQDNRLWYVIDRLGILSVEQAEGKRVTSVLSKHAPHKTTVPNLPDTNT